MCYSVVSAHAYTAGQFTHARHQSAHQALRVVIHLGRRLAGRNMSIDRVSWVPVIHKTSTFVVSSGVTLVVDAGGKLGSGRMAGRARWIILVAVTQGQSTALLVLESSPVKPKTLGKRKSSSFVVLFLVDRPRQKGTPWMPVACPSPTGCAGEAGSDCEKTSLHKTWPSASEDDDDDHTLLDCVPACNLTDK
jgi:hypothetical protein